MDLVKRKILHFLNNSRNADKVYIIEVFRSKETCGYVESLVVTWGRRTSQRLTSQTRLHKVSSPRAVLKEYNSLIKEKEKKGYAQVPLCRVLDGSTEIPGYYRQLTNDTNDQIVCSTANIPVREAIHVETNLTRNIT